MEQNANNRLLNEEELEKVSGGSEEKELISTSWFKCKFCGSNMVYTNCDIHRCPMVFCGGCDRNIQDCREK